MVPLGSHSSRTLTCTTVNDQKTVNHTERDWNTHTALLWLSTSLQISFCFSFISTLSLIWHVYVCECLRQYKYTSFLSLRRCSCLNKNTEKWHLISTPPFNKESLSRLNSSLYDFAKRRFWRTLNILTVSFWKRFLAAFTSRCQLPRSF